MANATALMESCSVTGAAVSNMTALCAPGSISTLPESGFAVLLLRLVAGLILFPWCLALPAAVFTWVTRSIPKLLLRKDLPQKLDGGSVWTIHGKRYNLSEWVQDHPGGARAIELGRNRDCTGLFESYHVFSDQAKLEKVLARFEIKSEGTAKTQAPAQNSTGLEFNDAFHEDVKKMVREHFQGQSSKMKPAYAWCFGFLTIFEAFLAYQFMMGSNIALVLFPTVGWLMCCNLGHDGSHSAVSSRPWVNNLASLAAMPMFFPSTCWNLQHVVQHHVYTNDHDDVDLYHFLPAARTSPLSKWTVANKLQWLTIFLVLPTAVGHLLFVVPMDLLTGLFDPITETKRYEQAENLEDFVANHRTVITLEFLGCILWFVANLYVQGLSTGTYRLILAYSIASFWFIGMTQGAHLQEGCHFEKSRYSSWAKRQAATSLNFCPDSHFWSFMSGGLNVQSLHHVIPVIGSSHFVDLYPKFKVICAKHGLELQEVQSATGFFAGFLNWVSMLSSKDVPAKTGLKEE